MSSSSVWVQLYYKGEDEPKRQPVKIKPIPKNVGALKAVVLPKLDPAELAEVFVYPPDTEPPFSQANSIRPGKKLVDWIDELKNATPPTSDDHPLIVVAPAPNPTPQQQPAASEQILTIMESMQSMLLREERVQKNSLKVTGGYFATLREIWGKKRIKVDYNMGAEALKLIQSRITVWSPTFLERCQMPSKEDIKDEIHVPRPEWRTEEAKRVFFSSPQASFSNIFLTPAAGKPSDRSPTHRSLAHAASASPKCSVFWTYFLELLTGENKVTMENEEAKLQRFYTVHGRWNFSMANLDDFHNYEYQGLKNLPQNLLALPPEHDKFYDGTRGDNLIIVPIVDLDPSRDPDGNYGIKSQYDLLVIGKTQAVYNWIYNGEVPSSASPYSRELDKSVEEAVAEEIEIARAFLEKYAIAAAYLGLQSLKPDLISTEETGSRGNPAYDALWVSKVVGQTVAHKKQPENGSQESAKSTASLKTAKSSQGSKNDLLVKNIERAKTALESVEKDGVWVPDSQASFEDHKVMKVKLSEYLETCGLKNELYPAWSLLGFKALANFLVYAEQPFIAGCETLDPPRNDLPVASIEINMVSDLESDLSDDEACVWSEYSSGDERDDQSKEGCVTSPLKFTATVVTP